MTKLTTTTAEVLRNRHLDYLDTETLQYYLSGDAREDFDVAVMFYAQWCRNCHSFAPYWDQIAQILQAGTNTRSKLIMGLFDCEENYEHMALCEQAGVKHYPTMMFINLAGQKLQRQVPKHASKFVGNWQYTDSVYDWLRAMSGVANWHRSGGWGHRLRQIFWGVKSQDKGLPVGIPGRAGGSAATTSGSGNAATATTASLEQYEKANSELEKLVLRSSVLVETFLFPIQVPSSPLVQGDTKNYTDVFAMLQSRWLTPGNMDDQILRTCTMEISLDYCSRLSNKLVENWIDGFGNVEDITEADLITFQAGQMDEIKAHEPYCALVEDCILQDFTNDACRPAQCPFYDTTACRYLSACLSPSLQAEYRDALSKSSTDSQSSTTK